MKPTLAILITTLIGMVLGLSARLWYERQHWPIETHRIEQNVMLGIKAQCDNQKIPDGMKARPPQLLLGGEFYWCRPANTRRNK